MKIGIITCFGNNNYGNKLQNYALKKFIENKFGVDVYSLKSVNANYIVNLKKNVKSIGTFIINYNEFKRYLNFLKFNKFLNYSDKMVYLNKKSSFAKNFDYLIFGSDQIWNCQFEGKYGLMQGEYTPKNKNISYAASIGLGEIPSGMMSVYKNIINNFTSISVREQTAKEILNNIEKKDYYVNIDPTLLLSTEEWEKVVKIPSKFYSKKYIFTYFLGEISDKRKIIIQQCANENNCEIINIMDKKSRLYQCGPREFLYLIKNAFLICTDSFHASVFSFIFNKPFVIFDREDVQLLNMNSRLYDFLKKFEISDRICHNGIITKNNLTNNYKKSYMILEKERTYAYKYLEMNLKRENKI